MPRASLKIGSDGGEMYQSLICAIAPPQFPRIYIQSSCKTHYVFKISPFCHIYVKSLEDHKYYG